MADRRPKGTAMREANNVTISEPTIRGQIPYSGGLYVGYQAEPKRN
jgi:hypothetical protein